MPALEHLANRDLDVAAALPAAALPDAARIVIVGGGIVGASIAYHLAAAGERDVVLVERGTLTNGTTWHAAGLVSRIRGTHALTELARMNAETYERVGRESGIDPGLRRVGSLTVARTEERFREIRYPVSIARDVGLPSEIVDRDRIRELWPAAVVDDLVGGVFFPEDGTVNPGAAALGDGPGSRRPWRPLRPGDGRRGVPLRARRTAGDRAADDGWRDRRRGRRPGRRPVDVRAGAGGRRERRPLSGRARVGHDRADPGRDRGPPVPARPRRVPVHPAPPGRLRRRRVRAERQADRPGAGPDRRVRRVRAGLGALRAGPGRGAPACAGPRVGRLRPLPSRAGELHARTRCRRSGSCPRCRACSWRLASIPRGSSSAPASAGHPPNGSWRAG